MMSEPIAVDDDALGAIMDIKDAKFEAFDGDIEVTPAARLAEKREVEDKAQPAEEPPKPSNPGWQNTPSVPGQLQRFPDTVRMGAVTTYIFNLSEEDQLKRYNAIQAGCHANPPTMAITSSRREFYEGKWHCCVDVAAIEYQRLSS